MNAEDSTPQGPVGLEGPEGPAGLEAPNETAPPSELFVYLVQTLDEELGKFYIIASVKADIKVLSHGRLDILGEMVNKLIEVNDGVKEGQKVIFSLKRLAKYEEESEDEKTV